MERKTLSSFIKPLNYYYDVKTDRNVPMDPARDETPRPAAVALLPEYGNLPEHMPTGTRIIIGKHKVELRWTISTLWERNSKGKRYDL